MYSKFRALGTQELIDLIQSGKLPPEEATYAAEVLGSKGREPEIFECLFKLLMHPSAVLREGAILGIGAQKIPDFCRTHLEWISKNDVSPSVRQTALENLGVSL